MRRVAVCVQSQLLLVHKRADDASFISSCVVRGLNDERPHMAMMLGLVVHRPNDRRTLVPA